MPYFTTDELRALPQMGDTDKFPADRVTAVTDALVSIIEREVGTSFVALSVTETLTGSRQSALVLAAPYVQSLTSLTVGGVSVDVGTLELRNGVVRYLNGSRWRAGDRDNVVVTYMAGYPGGVPADIKEALLWAVRDRLLATAPTAGIDARRTSMITDQGTINYVLSGVDRPTGYPDLDAAILNWRNAIRVPSVG